MRAFVAIEVPPWGVGPADGAPTPAHLTLRFLGDLRPDRIAPVSDRLEQVARRHAPFDLLLAGIGAFPSATNPRVVWVGATDGSAELTAVANAVREILRGEGTAEPEDTFVPHVTLFRVRSASGRRSALDLLEGRRAGPPPRRIRVEELLLKESVLGPGGAVHRTVAAFRLGRGLASVEGAGAEERSETSRRQR